jgi:CRISPR-associated protein Csx1
LNRVFLGNEVGNTKVKIKNKVDDGKDWQLLIKIHGSGEKLGSPDKRNYFAHSGLEGLVTEFRKESGKIFVRYVEKYLDNNGNEKSVSDLIKRWLKEEL